MPGPHSVATSEAVRFLMKITLPVLALGVMAGCGSSGGGGTTTVTTTASGTTTEQALDPASAQSAVTQYYADIDSYAYGQAWGDLGTQQRQEDQGFQTWKAGYGHNVETNLRSADPTVIDSDTVAVAVHVNSLDYDVCDNPVRQTFEGTWTVDLVGGRPVLDHADIAKIGGGELVTDASVCGGSTTTTTTPTTTTSGPSCDPNYSGACLDPNASDYDCAGGTGDGPEYTGTVTVIGDDHFGLDRDGDGVGCE
jgi:hypothetical protein